MENNDISALRATLFETLNGVKSGAIGAEQAKCITEIAQTIINTAKVEVDFIRATGASYGTGFIALDGQDSYTPTPAGLPAHSGTTTHRMR